MLQPTHSRRCLGLAATLVTVLSLLAASPAFAAAGPAEAQPASAALSQRVSRAWAKQLGEHRPAPSGRQRPFPAQYPAPLAQYPAPASPSNTPSELAVFASTVIDGQAGALRGVYVPEVLALRVIQQPAANFYVDLTPGIATQFTAASANGVTGLLADNVSSGTLFYGLAPGQTVSLIYGDGTVRRYVITGLDRFQALSPTSPYSDFVNLASGARLSATDLFNQMYSGGDKVTFQTCIAQDGVMSWGRLFVTAVPAN